MAFKKGEKIKKWIDLDNFIHYDNGRINWEKSKNIKILFEYGDCKGTIEVLNLLGNRKCVAMISSGDYTRKYIFNCADIINCKFGKALTKPIAETNPELIKYFVNKSDAYKYSSGSGVKVDMQCPFCGSIAPKIVKHLVERGFTCSSCSDGISWPNKFMFNILSQLKVNFKREVTKSTPGFEWIKNNYRYDFCVWLKEKCILIEMDGQYHFEDRFKTCEETQLIDREKDKMAKEHNIELIRIDCNYKDTYERFKYIRTNVINSKLNFLLNLNMIDWNEAHMFANNNSDVFLVAQCWNEGMNSQDIAKKLKISKSSTRCHLIVASELGLCNYNAKKSRERGAQYRAKNTSRCKPVVLFYKNKMIGVHISASDLYRKSDNLYGKHFSISVISEICNNKRRDIDGYTMIYISNEEYEQLMLQFSKQYKINEDMRKEEIYEAS